MKRDFTMTFLISKFSKIREENTTHPFNLNKYQDKLRLNLNAQMGEAGLLGSRCEMESSLSIV